MAFSVMCLAFAVVPASASAVTGYVNGDTLYINGGPEANAVDIDGTSSTTIDVQDPAGVSAGPGCVIDTGTPNVLDCGDQTTVKVFASLGAGDDSFTDKCIWCGTIFTWQHAINSIAVDVGSGNNLVQSWNTDSSTGIQEKDIQAGDGDNTISVTDGKNVIDVGNGNNTINLSDGTNEVALGNGANTVNGLDGTDTIQGGSGHNTIKDGFFCGANVCTVGSLTFYGVDGGADTVTCSTGPNVIYVDQFDVLSSDCTNVHRVLVGTGAPTVKPKVAPFAKQCVRRGGRTKCTPAQPLANHKYHTTTSQGSPINLKTDKHGRHYTLSPTKLTFLCPGGDGQNANVATDQVDVAASDHQAISKKGTFSTEVDYDPAQGWSNEVVYVVGAFNGRKAKGTIVGNAYISGLGECSTGVVKWSTN